MADQSHAVVPDGFPDDVSIPWRTCGWMLESRAQTKHRPPSPRGPGPRAPRARSLLRSSGCGHYGLAPVPNPGEDRPMAKSLNRVDLLGYLGTDAVTIQVSGRYS